MSRAGFLDIDKLFVYKSKRFTFLSGEGFFMARMERDLLVETKKEKISWVVVDKELIGGDSLLGQFPQAGLQILSEESMPLAYDVNHDVKRWEELRGLYGEELAREYLAEEMHDDIQTHFGELGGETTRSKYFEYSYVIGKDGRLREESGEQALISEWFMDQQYEVVGDLWLSHMIPFLEEDAQVGQSAFTLSVRADSAYEGAYDYGYFFIKTSENQIDCFGVELDLSRDEERKVINNQLLHAGAPQNVLLDEEFDWKDGRGRAVFYESGEFVDFEQMFAKIVGEVLEKERGEYELMDLNTLRDFIASEREKVNSYEENVVELGEEIISALVNDRKEELDEMMARAQLQHLMRVDPELLRDSMEQGFVVLACGIVNMSFDDGDFDTISSILSSENSWSYHNGNCANCKRKNLEVGPCSICKRCEKELSKE